MTEDELKLNAEMQEQDIKADENAENITYIVSSTSPAEQAKLAAEYGTKFEYSGKAKIVSVDFTKLRTTDEDGQIIQPIKSMSSDVKYYKIKLKIVFEIDGNDSKLVEYYPGVKVFINDANNVKLDKVNITLSRPEFSESAVAKLLQLYADTYNVDLQELSDAEFMQALVGKTVELKVIKGKFAGANWFRNDIIKFYK